MFLVKESVQKSLVGKNQVQILMSKTTNFLCIAPRANYDLEPAPKKKRGMVATCKMRGCVRCIAWQEHYYWNHMDDKKYFCILVAGDFKHSMCIPEKFAKNFMGKISGTIKLQAPNGSMYTVGASKQNGRLAFRSGWKAFVNAHHIRENDLLVFKYCRNSTFKVLIFDSSGCERSVHVIVPVMRDDTAEIIGPPQHHKIVETKTVKMTSSATLCKKSGEDFRSLKREFGKQSLEPDKLQMAGDFDYVLSSGTFLTKAQEEKVVQIVSAIKSEIPLYVSVMKKANVDLKCCFLNIPSICVNNFKEQVSTTIKLEACNGNEYNVGAMKHSDKLVLRSGWATFVSAHHIEENDLLIFKYSGNSHFTVLIFNSNGCGKTSSCLLLKAVPDAQETSADSVQVIEPPPKITEPISLSSSSDHAVEPSPIKRLTGVRTARASYNGKAAKTALTVALSDHTGEDVWSSESESDDDIEMPSGPGYVLSRSSRLTRAQEKKVAEILLSIQPAIPVYVAVLCGYNVGPRHYSLRIGAHYAATHLPYEDQIITLQRPGKSKKWHARFHIKRDKSRPLFSFWREFVDDNRLQQGDICLFEPLKDARSPTMNIHLIRGKKKP